MRIEKLLIDHSIEFSTEHKNVRDGWIGMDCPFCGSTGKCHLGYNLDENYFSCWQCGGHGTEYTISRLLRISRDKAAQIVLKYGGKSKNLPEPSSRRKKERFKLPTDINPLNSRSRTYLKNRGFIDPDELVRIWDLKHTGPSSKLGDISYKHRILAPVYWDGRMVSFQARDFTDQQFAKYKACPPEWETISHKQILYGKQEAWTKRGLCVEGITDVWRLGTDAFGTFGIKFTREQIRQIKRHFEEVVVLYDPEKWAQRQARQLVNELIYKGVKAWNVELHCDPGDLSQEEADTIVSDLMK